MVDTFRRRRDRIVEGLNKLPGFSCAPPKGAFYAFPNTGAAGVSGALAERLLDEAGVACLAGTAFGGAGEGYLRFSYAAGTDTIDEALRRIRALLS